MENQPLTAGTVLNDHYRIESLLGAGGFGMTYEAVNTHMGLRVAVKELYWRGHTGRAENGALVLTKDSDAEAFEGLRQRFLDEARTMSGLSGEDCIAQVMDYFEENNTAYIVMEFVEGIPLEDYILKQGPMQAEALLERILPLADCLGRIHAGGIIHRDISPRNLMIRPDGSLKLIDFGAAKEFTGGVTDHTAMASDSYAPMEQYDRHGTLGPWTDVYALCAVLYFAVTGARPDSAIQRLFLDELKKPSELGIAIKPQEETIILRGLMMDAPQRYQSMGELSAAIRQALPEKDAKKKRPILAAVLAGVLVLLLAGIGIFCWHRYDEAHPFRGVETETFIVKAPDGLSASDFVAAEDDLKSKLEAFAGSGNYRITRDGTAYQVVLPLSCFDGQEITGVLADRFEYLLDGTEFDLNYQIKANWEDPSSTMLAGEYQVKPGDLTGETAVIIYYPNFDWGLSRGEQASVAIDLKTRLDTLHTPYAIGTLYGDEKQFVIRISTAALSRFTVFALGTDLYLVGEGNDSYLWLSSFNTGITESPASVIASCTSTYDQQKLDSFLETMQGDKIYLAARYSADIYRPIAWTTRDDASDGVLTFTEFTLQGDSATDENKAAMVRLINAIVNETNFPTGYWLIPGNFNILDADGNMVFENAGSRLFGQQTALRDSEQN